LALAGGAISTRAFLRVNHAPRYRPSAFAFAFAFVAAEERRGERKPQAFPLS